MRCKYLIKVSLLAATLAIPGVPAAQAATNTTSFAVTATVLSFCSITALPLAFGNYSSTAVLNGTTTLTVTCTNTTPYNVGLDAGTGSGATVAVRKMTNGLSTLNYTLSRDASRTNNFGQTVGTDTASGNGAGVAQVITVYGQITAGQLVTPGVYTDTITATITY